MPLTKLAIKRPVSTFLLIITLIVFGISSLSGFKLGFMPPMETPMLVVSTIYAGADADVIDETVTKPIEDIGEQISGFEGVSSVSKENNSQVRFSFSYETDLDEAYMELKTSLDRLSLPDGTQEPMIMKAGTSSESVMTLSVTSETGADVLAHTTGTIVPAISTLSGVSQVNVSGGSEGYVSVLLDETALAQYGLTPDSVSSAIKAANYTMPAGSVSQGNQDLSVFSKSETESLYELANVPITTPAKTIISLDDVADVSLSTSEVTSVSRYNGEENISIEVIPEQDADLIAVADEIEKTIAPIIATNEDINLEIVSDTSVQIEDSLLSVVYTLIIAVVLCMFVLFLFLGDIKASIIAGSSIPTSLVMTLIAMSLSGFELNMITTTALVITIGMTVDNAIVILESIFKTKSDDTDFKDAAIQGVKSVGASVVASTITTIVVYAPIMFLSGTVGSLFAELSATVVYAMIASIFCAMTIVPLLYVKFKPKEKSIGLVSKGLKGLENVYGKVINKIVKKKAVAICVAVVALVGTFSLASQIDIIMLPPTNNGIVVIGTEFKPGTNLETINEESTYIENKLINDENIDRYTMTANASGAIFTAYVSNSSNTDEVIENYKADLSNVVGYETKIFAKGNYAEDSGFNQTITVSGANYESVKSAAEEMTDTLYNIDGITKVTSSISATKSKVNVEIDPMLAMQSGVNSQSALNTIRVATSGSNAGAINLTGTEYNIVVEYPDERYDAASDLATLAIPTTTGTTIPLESIATIGFTDTMQEISRINGVYTIDLNLSGDEAQLESLTSEIGYIINNTNYSDVSFNDISSSSSLMDSINELLGAIMISIFLVFIVMAMQFESPRFSVMVMMSIVFSFIGSILLLFMTGQDISIISLMGMLMLVGIVVNNGILFVDTTNELKEQMPVEEALITAGKMRMRPILMTTLTTMLSMLPVAFGIGEGSLLLQSMGIVIIGGLVTSTLLVLLLMPTFYLIFSKKKRKA